MKVRLYILLTMVVLAGALATAAFASNQIYTAHLAGDNEVPSNLSLAQGQAMFWLNKDGTAIEYQLIAANIEYLSGAQPQCYRRGEWPYRRMAISRCAGGAADRWSLQWRVGWRLDRSE